jgi:hypothetical protein
VIKRRLFLVAAAGAMVLLALPGQALAKPVEVDTEHLKLRATPDLPGQARYQGKLGTETGKIVNKKGKSDDKAVKRKRNRANRAEEECLDGRVVSVYHRGILIARTLTDENGLWNVVGPLPPKGDEVEVRAAGRVGGLAKCLGTVDTLVPGF